MEENKDIAIKISELSKKYIIGKKKDGSLRGSITNIFSNYSNKGQDFWALRDLNFEIFKGDIVGIIGRNGAGKSTLLKILSKITKPTTGRIEIDGRVASLLEVGTGFHVELTGRENIFLNGTILGMSRKEVAEKFDEIVAFSGVEKFIDTPVKRYSSGQYVRLAFAVAAHLEPEILIIDEVLAVGDAEFQKKCLGKMKNIAGQGRTVIFVSHDIGAVTNLCNKGILLENGAVRAMGDVKDVVDEYLSITLDKSGNDYNNIDSKKTKYIKSAGIIGKLSEISSDNDISFQLEVNATSPFLKSDRILVRILDQNEKPITSFEKELNKKDYTLKIPQNHLKKGHYSLSVILYQPAVEVYEEIVCCHFTILNNNKAYSHLETFDTGNFYSEEAWLE